MSIKISAIKNSSVLIFYSLLLFLLIVSTISCTPLSRTAKGAGTDNIETDKEIIMLERPAIENEMSLGQAIKQRRSIRNFDPKELSMDEISLLLWASQGITDESAGFRSVPSAGALYPLEVFLIKSDGAFQYIPEGHRLVRLSSKDLRSDIMKLSLFQSFIADAPVTVILCGIYERTTSKYGERGKMYVHMEAGHACQNLLLQATALGLGAVPVGAFNAEAIAQILDMPKDYVPLYIVPVGYPAP